MDSRDYSAFEQALGELRREQALLDAVKAKLGSGWEKSDVMSALYALRAKLIEAHRDEEEDLVLEVMDYVVGWSSPHMQL